MSNLQLFLTQIHATVLRDYANSIMVEVDVNQLVSLMTPLDLYYPPFQRKIDYDRVIGLKNEQITEYEKNGGYGIIHSPIVLGHIVGHTANQYGIYITDGQHRMNTLLLLMKLKLI